MSFSCSGLPAKSSCTFAPNPVPPGTSPTDVTVTISTTATTTASLNQPRGFYAAWLGLSSMGLIGLAGLVAVGNKKNRKNAVILGGLALMTVLMLVSCGGTPKPTIPGTPQGTST